MRPPRRCKIVNAADAAQIDQLVFRCQIHLVGVVVGVDLLVLENVVRRLRGDDHLVRLSRAGHVCRRSVLPRMQVARGIAVGIVEADAVVELVAVVVSTLLDQHALANLYIVECPPRILAVGGHRHAGGPQRRKPERVHAGREAVAVGKAHPRIRSECPESATCVH